VAVLLCGLSAAQTTYRMHYERSLVQNTARQLKTTGSDRSVVSINATGMGHLSASQTLRRGIRRARCGIMLPGSETKYQLFAPSTSQFKFTDAQKSEIQKRCQQLHPQTSGSGGGGGGGEPGQMDLVYFCFGDQVDGGYTGGCILLPIIRY